jgi:hypothetical protein
MLSLDVLVAEIDPADTAALHSWYYALLTFREKPCGMAKVLN